MEEITAYPKKPYVDYTLLSADAVLEGFSKLCADALAAENRPYVRGVCVLPEPRIITFCKKAVEQSGMLVSVVNDFPLGRGGREAKYRQGNEAKELGIREIDTVLNTGLLREGRYKEVEDELRPLVELFHGAVKVIIESGHAWYTEELIKEAAHIVAAAGAFCAKTSTGFIDNIPPEAKTQHVMWMHEAEPQLVKKAAGGFKKMGQVQPILDAVGPEKLIIGASSQFWMNP